jgi:hypothetical protein
MKEFFQRNPDPVKLAYLSFDEFGNPYINVQNKGEIVVWQIPISFGHLGNIVADGAAALAKRARKL